MKGITFLTACLGLSFALAYPQAAPSGNELQARRDHNKGLYSQYDHGPDLRQRASVYNKDYTRTIPIYETEARCLTCPPSPQTYNPQIVAAVRQSSLVAIGHIVSQISGFTDSGAFVFTDSEFVLDQVWHSSGAGPCNTEGCEITITTPGGTAKVGAHTVRVILTNQQQLQDGRKYLLFLHYVSQSDSYQPIDLIGFRIDKAGILPLASSRTPPARDLLNQPDLFLQTVRSSVIHADEELQ